MPWFQGSQGRVHHDAWLPEDRDVRSVVVFVHGYAEHIGLYDAFARRLTADGHAVYAFDCVGHGRSDGERAVIPSWDDLVADARTLLSIAASTHPGVPLVVAGHSAGSVAAFLLALRHPGESDALVLSGGPLRPLGWVTEQIAGTAEVREDLDPTGLLSTHPDYVHALMHDPLVYPGGFRTETLEALAATWPEVDAGLESGRPDLPALVLNGEEDPIVPVEVSREVASRLPRATLRTFPGDLHDILNEHDRDDVHDVVAEFVGRVRAPARLTA
ncbi:MAG TPA: alpha/beta fold hydrolase [Actinomycetes bacterium]|nr:alpha/beta fold hydrolase [Actinomycetes bacterium]